MVSHRSPAPLRLMYNNLCCHAGHNALEHAWTAWTNKISQQNWPLYNCQSLPRVVQHLKGRVRKWVSAACSCAYRALKGSKLVANDTSFALAFFRGFSLGPGLLQFFVPPWNMLLVIACESCLPVHTERKNAGYTCKCSCRAVLVGGSCKKLGFTTRVHQRNKKLKPTHRIKAIASREKYWSSRNLPSKFSKSEDSR